jgi:5-hydroxyisourate hydrolase
MTTLSTHVLDTAHGMPAGGIPIELEGADGPLFGGTTDTDGRCPALRELTLPVGRYRLIFAVADYFRAKGAAVPDPPFLDRIAIDFGIANAGGHYHVPLLVSPFGYSTYRGS